MGGSQVSVLDDSLQKYPHLQLMHDPGPTLIKSLRASVIVLTENDKQGQCLLFFATLTRIITRTVSRVYLRNLLSFMVCRLHNLNVYDSRHRQNFSLECGHPLSLLPSVSYSFSHLVFMSGPFFHDTK